jgi:predicted nucleic acid-binding protein
MVRASWNAWPGRTPPRSDVPPAGPVWGIESDAARAYGRVTAAMIDPGRSPRRRTVDLMIASTAIAAGLPLFTTNPDGFAGLADLLLVVPVSRPQVHRERSGR